MSEFKIQFEVFEGPLDLLLYLVKKEEVDIYEVNLTKLATQFIEYVDLMRRLDLDVAGEFLVMAATLMHIKSRELLPVDQQVETGEEEEEPDPRWELIRKLVEYKRFKDTAADLQKLELERAKVYTRLPGSIPIELPSAGEQLDLSIFDLIQAVNDVLKKFRERNVEQEEIASDRWTVSEKIEWIRECINRQVKVKFGDLFQVAAHRDEVVATFLALLELIRLRQVLARQREPYGEIAIEVAPRETVMTLALEPSSGGEKPGGDGGDPSELR